MSTGKHEELTVNDTSLAFVTRDSSHASGRLMAKSCEFEGVPISILWHASTIILPALVESYSEASIHVFSGPALTTFTPVGLFASRYEYTHVLDWNEYANPCDIEKILYATGIAVKGAGDVSVSTKFGLMVFKIIQAPIARRRPMMASRILSLPAPLLVIDSLIMYSTPPIMIIMTAKTPAMPIPSLKRPGRYLPNVVPPDVVFAQVGSVVPGGQ